MLRDNFSANTKRRLAKRAGHICSFPDCKVRTTGPSQESSEAINDIGKAAHIHAASPGGPRYDSSMTQEQRRSIDNGIWLCATHADLIDRDVTRFSADEIRRWKREHERYIESTVGTPVGIDDRSHRNIFVDTALLAQVEKLTQLNISAIEKELDNARENWRNGKKNAAIVWTAEVKNDPHRWGVLTPETQAKILRFEAGLALETPDGLKLARQLAGQAAEIAPEAENTILLALIAHAEDRYDDALALLCDRAKPEMRDLQVALLLERNNVEEAWLLIRDDVPNERPERIRLRALVQLALGRMTDARTDIQKALALKPQWYSVRLATAIIDYCSTLSPATFTREMLPWPTPMTWAYVRTDDESQLRNRTAAESFRKLIEENTDTDERRILEGWYLASLLNDCKCQEAGELYCQQLLQAEPTHEWAILWIQARGLAIDLAPSLNALVSQREKNSLELPGVLTLIQLYLSRQETQNAREVLKEARSLFDKNANLEAWSFWWARSLQLEGRSDEAFAFLANAGANRAARGFRTFDLLINLNDKSTPMEWPNSDLEEYLNNLDEIYIFEICSLMSNHERWEYVAEHAERLVSSLQTADALELASRCAFNCQRYELCQGLLEENINLLPERRYTSHLHHMYVQCLRRTGNFSQALKEAEGLANADPSPTYRCLLIDLLFDIGDFKRISIIARQLEHDSQLDATTAIRLASTLRIEDREQATRLWRRANELGITDELVTTAITVAHALGEDTQTRDLTERMCALAHTGAHEIQQLSSLEDVIQLENQRREYVERINEMYQQGRVPIHLVAQELNLSLARIYDINFSSTDLSLAPTLFIRHGRRPIGYPLQKSLRLDITAILLAKHIDILSLIENAFAPLMISSGLIRTLADMQIHVSDHQPRVSNSHKRLVELVQSGRIQVAPTAPLPVDADWNAVDQLGASWIAAFELARSQGGFLVDFLPLTKAGTMSEPAQPPKNADTVVASCSSVVRALIEQGALPETRLQSVIDALGSAFKEDNGITPTRGALLYCRHNIVSVFIQAGLMDVLLRQFNVVIEKREFEYVRARCSDHSQQADLRHFIGELTTHLQRGLENGTYQFLPKNTEVEREKTLPYPGPAIDCLVELISQPAVNGTAAWVDDRYILAYDTIGQVPIVSILDVLEMLVRAGDLTLDEYYERIATLRAARAWFIPISCSEIIHWLEQAPVEDDRLVETRELACLRQTLAAIILQVEWLQRPNPPKQAGEFGTILESVQAVYMALTRVWDIGSISKSLMYAEWLIEHLYISFDSVIRNLYQTLDAEAVRRWFANQAATLITYALTLDGSSVNDQQSPRQVYLRWLNERLLNRRLSTDPELLPIMVDSFGNIFSNFLQSLDSEQARRLAAYEFRSAVAVELPEVLASSIRNNIELCERFAWPPIVPVISLRNTLFEPRVLWDAVQKAFNEGRSKLISIKGEQVEIIPLRKSKDEVPGVLVNISTNKEFNIHDWTFGLLFEQSRAGREEILSRHRHLFDIAEEAFGRIAVELSTIEDIPQRMSEVNIWLSENTANYYDNIPIQIQQRQPVRIYPPNAHALLRHYRFDIPFSSSSLQEQFNHASKCLIQELGVKEALVRLIGLPIRLPDFFVEHLQDMPPNERRALIRSLLSLPASPISRLHLIRIFVDFKDDNPAYLRLAILQAKILVDHVLNGGFAAFLSLLQLVHDYFERWSETSEWPFSMRLAITWLHTHRHYAASKIGGRSDEWLLKTCEQTSTYVSYDPLLFYDHRQLDIAHPQQQQGQRFALMGLAYSFTNAHESAIQSIRATIVKLILSDEAPKYTSVLEQGVAQDISLAPNVTDSFLGGDLGQRAQVLLGTDCAKYLTRNYRQRLTSEALDILTRNGSQLQAWKIVVHTVGDLPIYPNLLEKLSELIVLTRVDHLLQENYINAVIVMRFLCMQSLQIEDAENRKHVRRHWNSFHKELAKQAGQIREQSDEYQEKFVTYLILEIVFIIARLRANDNDNNYYAELANSLDSLTSVDWIVTSSYMRHVVENLCFELSPVDSQWFWPLLSKLRSQSFSKSITLSDPSTTGNAAWSEASNANSSTRDEANKCEPNSNLSGRSITSQSHKYPGPCRKRKRGKSRRKLQKKSRKKNR